MRLNSSTTSRLASCHGGGDGSAWPRLAAIISPNLLFSHKQSHCLHSILDSLLDIARRYSSLLDPFQLISTTFHHGQSAGVREEPQVRNAHCAPPASSSPRIPRIAGIRRRILPQSSFRNNMKKASPADIFRSSALLLGLARISRLLLLAPSR